MKLKEKIYNIISNTKYGDITAQEAAEKCEIICDEFSVNFSEWTSKNGWYYNVWNDNKWHNKANTHFDTTPSKELLLKFKEETYK